MSSSPSIPLPGDAPLSTIKHLEGRQAADTLDIDGEGDELSGRTVTINRPRAELYAFWRDLSNLPTFMDSLERITVLDPVRSHWVVAAPAGQTVEWDALIVEDVPDTLIAWRSTEGASVPNSGRVEFKDAPAGRGTEVTATLLYDPPVGAVGKLVAKLFQREPNIQTRRELRRFKQLMETGEISTAEPPAAAPRA
jgi:uncharacterized membrane protein